MYPNGFGYGQMQSVPQQTMYGQVQTPMMQPQQNYSAMGYNRPPTIAQNINTINGRIVTNVNEVTPDEVPMNRQLSFFPMADGSCVYAKVWDDNGNLNTFRYILEQPDAIEVNGEVKSTLVDDILGRLDQIEQTIASSTIKPKYNNQRQNNSKPNKEVDDA